MLTIIPDKIIAPNIINMLFINIIRFSFNCIINNIGSDRDTNITTLFIVLTPSVIWKNNLKKIREIRKISSIGIKLLIATLAAILTYSIWLSLFLSLILGTSLM